MTPKEFFTRWWWGMKHLTPRSLLEAKMFGTAGMIVGILGAWYVMFQNGMGYWGVFMFFFAFVQFFEFLGVRKQWLQAKETEEVIKKMSEVEDDGL